MQMGKSLIAKRPYTYLKYPRLTTNISTAMTTENNLSDVEGDMNSQSNDDNGEKDVVIDDNESISSTETTENYSRTSLMTMLNSLYFKEVRTKGLFDYGFYTARQMYDDLTTHMPRLHEFVKFTAFSKWITDANFGPRTCVRLDDKPVKGRHLYKIKDSAAGKINETTSAFRQELENRGPNWITVGYVRKSVTKESDENTTRLLQLMINKLQNRCFCSRIYASPNSQSTKSIMERDFDISKRNANIVANLTGCDGNAQDMLQFLTHTTKNVQLCIISYAGLSTRPDDVESFLRACRMAKVLAVDHDSQIESIDRYAFLHGDKAKLQKFKSRSGCIKRSKNKHMPNVYIHAKKEKRLDRFVIILVGNTTFHDEAEVGIFRFI
ncbi:uncharacterized protein BYT42DRAFT_330231 [Radiomyces spectabilis]|uniref:uncharacterized protein n=1 Tax=Radiomyces spectabilis TaxID=64574 RepID=UPI00221FEE67|nr:uncharacterized protein BYT42DRAFT_330231 [Radiomyces spectabilis]KAI8379530.1 hypothetical protein BYT42DRAFT_330231 [Radiomyces spectabilis]